MTEQKQPTRLFIVNVFVAVQATNADNAANAVARVFNSVDHPTITRVTFWTQHHSALISAPHTKAPITPGVYTGQSLAPRLQDTARAASTPPPGDGLGGVPDLPDDGT